MPSRMTTRLERGGDGGRKEELGGETYTRSFQPSISHHPGRSGYSSRMQVSNRGERHYAPQTTDNSSRQRPNSSILTFPRHYPGSICPNLPLSGKWCCSLGEVFGSSRHLFWKSNWHCISRKLGTACFRSINMSPSRPDY